MIRTFEPYDVYIHGVMDVDNPTSHSGPCGWAYIITHNFKVIKSGASAIQKSTHQRAELKVAVEALQQLDTIRNTGEKACVHTQSSYLLNCYDKEWYKMWLKNNWTNYHNEQVANSDLWGQLIPYFKNKNIDFVKIPYDTGNYYECMCINHAVQAATYAKQEYQASMRRKLYGTKME